MQNEDYKNIIENFTRISSVPRGSGYNEKISRFLVDYAKSKNVEYYQDEFGNVIIYLPASKGCEKAPSVILQGHMDMVCVKKQNSNHDFTRDGLELVFNGDYISAKDTTLGADDGISIAYAMSLIDDKSSIHPRMELVFTVDEETGMDGAIALDAKKLSSRMLINCDSEKENVCWVSCAGGSRICAHMESSTSTEKGIKVKLSIQGLSGGHSGSDIHKYKTNAILQLNKALFLLDKEYDFMIVSFVGGEKDNAIPTNAEAVILLDELIAEDAILMLKKTIERFNNDIMKYEPQFTMNIEASNSSECVCLDNASTEKLIFLLTNVPNGVQKMSSDIEGLVETSLNLGIINISNENDEIHFSLRSSVMSELGYLEDKIKYFVDYIGGSCENGSAYPAWEYNKESYLRDLYMKAALEAGIKNPGSAAIHAGLECGIFAQKIKGADMISIGPDMYDIHTFNERLSISSSIRVYKILELILKGVAESAK